MKVDQVDMSNPLAQKIYQLKFQNGLSLFNGKYRDAIKAQKELAEIGVDNFELVAKIKAPLKITVPLLSIYGLRMILAVIIDKFRKKTPQEVQFREMCSRFKKGLLKV